MNTENQTKINALFDELVPRSGKAENRAGELVRAVCRIGYRFRNDGDMVESGYGKETCNAAARFLMVRGSDEVCRLVMDLAESNWSESLYEETLDCLIAAVIAQVEGDPSLRSLPTEDMWDHYDPEVDVDDEEDDEEEEE